VTTIGVGSGPNDMVWNPVQNRVYVANSAGSSISVIRDAVGIEEAGQPTANSRQPPATVLRGDAGLRFDAAGVVYDATGRRVTNPEPGVYFAREPVAGCTEQYQMRKVIVTR
jgi:DNA-binding beta-propeller fold protein YncE